MQSNTNTNGGNLWAEIIPQRWILFMWKYNPSLSEWNPNIHPPPDSTRIISHLSFLFHSQEGIKFMLHILWYFIYLCSKIPFSLIFLVKWVIRRLVLAYIGFREHNTSNFPLKLHNSLQFLNINLGRFFLNEKIPKKSNFVESFKIAGNIFSCSLPQLKPSQQI